MRRALAVVTILAACLAPASADECDKLAERLMGKHSLALERRTEGGAILMHHPVARDVSLSCARPPRSMDVWVSISAAHPPDDFFRLAGEIGATVTGGSDQAIAKAARSCSEMGLRAKDEAGSVRTRRFIVECQAFERDGGGTNLTIGKPDD